VLREDGSVRMWNAKEVRLPADFSSGIRDIVPQSSEWMFLKANGEVRGLHVLNQVQGAYQSLNDPEDLHANFGGATTAIATGGYAPVMKRPDGHWSAGKPGLVEDTLAKLYTQKNESFSVFRGEKEGIMWIEPVGR
jgi:hypothetical protein